MLTRCLHPDVIGSVSHLYWGALDTSVIGSVSHLYWGALDTSVEQLQPSMGALLPAAFYEYPTALHDALFVRRMPFGPRSMRHTPAEGNRRTAKGSGEKVFCGAQS